LGKVSLREGTDNDALLIMTWRNNPMVFKGFLKQKEPLLWENHIDYWNKRKNFKDWIIMYGEGIYERPVGQVNIVNTDTDCPEIGYFIGEVALWGRGIITEALKIAIDYIWNLGYKKICADVKPDNKSSIVVLRKLGFTEVDGRDGLIGYIKEKDIGC